MKRTVTVALALALPPTALLLARSGPATDDPGPASVSATDTVADSLIGRWIEAIGGLEVHARLRTARYALTTEMYDAASGRLRRTRPRYVTIARTAGGELSRVERWEGDDFIAQGWDGHREWATSNGRALGPGDKEYDEARYVAGDVHYWIGLPYKLRDPGVELHYQGMEGGRHLVTVGFGEGVGLHDGDTWRYWFDEGATWPALLAYREEGKASWNVLRFEDVRTVDGYVFVGRRTYVDGEGRVTKVLRTYDFELNPELDPATFAPPEAVAAGG